MLSFLFVKSSELKTISSYFSPFNAIPAGIFLPNIGQNHRWEWKSPPPLWFALRFEMGECDTCS